MSDIEFDPVAHRYTFEGRELPSVSAIIRDLSFADLWHVPAAVLKEAAEFGTRVHVLTEDYDRNNATYLPRFYDLPDRERACLDAWAAFRHEARFQKTHVEYRVHHEALGYAGTIDRIGILHDAALAHGRRVIIDIKTSEPHDWHGVQLAGYYLAARSQGLADMMTDRYAVYLRDDGTYRLRRYDAPDDISVFIAHLKKNREQQP